MYGCSHARFCCLACSRTCEGEFPNLLRLSQNFLCFHHEWGLSPSYIKDNGGKVGGKVGGKNGGNVPSLSPALAPVLSQDEEKDASIDAKDATSSSKVATLDEEVASLEPKDTKVKKKA